MSKMKQTLEQAHQVLLHIRPDVKNDLEVVAEILVEARYQLDGQDVGAAGAWLVQELEALTPADVERILWLEVGASIEIDMGAGGVRVVARVA